MDEQERHQHMIQFLIEQTGLYREQVEQICYAGEPWPELERLSATLIQAIKDAKHTGADPAVPLDVLHSLLKLEEELKKEKTAKDPFRDEVMKLQKRMERIVMISKEPLDVVKQVVSAILSYSYTQLSKSQRSKQK